ncbi:MAG: [acyl-carrier-protein] S-malonyltransferase [Candidatus Omnitrophota bacterium]|nr:MAG: [acyl-carrier-protein] S-malonyltransferase [Candidatus Omnitrophota bacterium]HDM08607.1 [acyl-carrier-protein] S-malonyltransferase [Candidatus Omnitrophota bacterium]
MRLAYIFPGQGTQYVGMGHDLYENFEIARELFHKANEILKFDIMRLCFFGPSEELTRTRNCQPAVFLVSTVALKCLEEYFRTQMGNLYYQELTPVVSAGLSLGEYAALVAADAISFEDALELVRRRGEFMEEACNENPGTMSAIIGLGKEVVEEICEESKAEIANVNSPEQIVIAGRVSCVQKAEELAGDKGAKRVIRLNVSGAFHSSLMEPAAKKLMYYLNDINIRRPKFTVVSNVNAYFSFLPQEIKANLVNQINHPTLWVECVKTMVDLGVTAFLEIGPGKTLRGLLRKIDPNLVVFNIETTGDIRSFYEELMLEEV